MKLFNAILVIILLISFVGCNYSVDKKTNINEDDETITTQVLPMNIEEILELNNSYEIYTSEEQIYSMGATKIEYQSHGPRNDIIKYIEGNYSAFPILTHDEALLSLEQIKYFIGCDSPNDEFIVEGKYRFNQIYKNIPVYAHKVDLSVDNNGIPTKIISDYLPNINLETVEPKINIQQAYEIINKMNVLNVYDDMELYIVEDIEKFEPKLAWCSRVSVEYEIWGTNTIGEIDTMYCIDAKTGEFLREYVLSIPE